MLDVVISIECAGMINGEIVTVRGEGLGSVDRGRLGMRLSFSSIPRGFSVHCATLWTSCCSTPGFAVERDGGVNMLTLCGGRYRCARTFDFGTRGVYDYNYELRLDRATNRLTARGVIQGSLDLPAIETVDGRFTEIMVPVGAREIRSFSGTTFHATDGSQLPVTVTGRYTPLSAEDPDWTCCARNQVRTSLIDVRHAEGGHLSLEYTTVICGISAPDPALLVGTGAR